MRRSFIPLFLLGALLPVACGEDRGSVSVNDGSTTSTTSTISTTATTPTEPADATVDVALNEWSVAPAEPTVKAGAVGFNAENEGKVPHELVVLKTDTKADALKVEGNRAKEEGENLGEVEGVEPGGSETLQVDLEPGHYVLLCNLPTHYEQGMRADLTVE